MASQATTGCHSHYYSRSLTVCRHCETVNSSKIHFHIPKEFSKMLKLAAFVLLAVVATGALAQTSDPCTSKKFSFANQDTKGLQCYLCEMVVRMARQYADMTEPEIAQLLMGSCAKLGFFCEGCVNVVRDYLPSIYQYLNGELSDRGICHQVHLC